MYIHVSWVFMSFAFGLQDLKSCYIHWFFACACRLCTILCLKTGSSSVYLVRPKGPQIALEMDHWDKSWSKFGGYPLFSDNPTCPKGGQQYPPSTGESGRPQLSRGHRDCHAAGHSLWIWVWRLIGLRLGWCYFLHSFFEWHTSNYLAWCKNVVPKINDESKNLPNVKNWSISFHQMGITVLNNS